MHDDLRYHARQKISKQTKRKSPIGPVMPVLHNLQRVSFEIHFSLEVHLMECLHWYLAFAIVPCPVFFVVEVQVMLDGSAGISRLFVLPW